MKKLLVKICPNLSRDLPPTHSFCQKLQFWLLVKYSDKKSYRYKNITLTVYKCFKKFVLKFYEKNYNEFHKKINKNEI